jgi:uncharacterized protein YicC (UPF0701 family)
LSPPLIWPSSFFNLQTKPYFKAPLFLHINIKMVAQTAEFKKAVEDSRKLKAKPSDDELLQVRKTCQH